MIIYDYVVEVVADVQPKEAFLKYIDINRMQAWQPNLLQIEPEKGILFQAGSSGYLIYEDSDKEMRMRVDVNLCGGNLFDATYRMNGVVNRCVNHFTKKDGKLLWKMIVNFQFKDEEVPEKRIFEQATKQAMLQFIAYLKTL